MKLGAFELVEELGRGGRGEVWRAVHGNERFPVAVKFVRGPIHERTRREFEREVRAHASLDHPGICYLLDYGTTPAEIADLEAASPYLVMELASGTLRDLMPVKDWDSVRTAIRFVLDALAHAHARDVIHRDLKPENILVFDAADGLRLKITDFGLAHALGREHHTSLSSLERYCGTLHYSAPEQLRSQWRDYGPWTDIYAVGCIVWEMVSGRTPFKGDTTLALASAHINQPRPALDPRFDVPAGLEQWIHKAMSATPTRRFRSAAAALDALDALDTSPLLPLERPREGTSTPTLHTKNSLFTLNDVAAFDAGGEFDPGAADTPVVWPIVMPRSWRRPEMERRDDPIADAGLGLFGLRELPFVGRDPERDRIWNALQDVVENQRMRIVVLSGGPGVGKSRLAEWMATRADELGLVKRLHAYHSAHNPAPFDGLPGLFQRVFRTWGLERESIFEQIVRTLPASDDDEALRMHDALALTEWMEPGKDNVTELRYHFEFPRQWHALGYRTIRRLSQTRPAFVQLDDLHWSTDTLDVLEFCLDAVERPPALFLATVRSDVLASSQALRERFESIKNDPAVEWIELEPLVPSDHRSMLAQSLRLTPETVERLAARTEGNPLFAAKLLSHVIHKGDLESTEFGFDLDSGASSLPDDITELWTNVIDRVVRSFDPTAASHVRMGIDLAATLGRRVKVDEWTAVCDHARIKRPANFIGQLAEQGIVIEVPDGFEFTHGLLVDSVMESARLRGIWASLNRTCATVLDATQTTGAFERRARHWQHAGDEERTLELLLAAESNAYTHGDIDAQRRILMWRQDILDTIGAAEDDGRRLENNGRLSGVLRASGDDEACRTLALAVMDADEDICPTAIVNAASSLSVVYRRRGDYELAAEYAQKAVDVGQRSQSFTELFLAFGQLGWVRLVQGEYDACEEAFLAAGEVARHLRDSYRILLSESYLITLDIELGRSEKAASRSRTLIDNAREEGFREVEAIAALSTGEVAKYAGDYESALSHYSRYESLIRAMGLRVSAGVALMNQAMCHIADQSYEAGEVALEAAYTQLNSVGVEGRNGVLDLAKLALAAGKNDLETFDQVHSNYLDGWPDDKDFERDAPWLAEIAMRHANEKGDTDRAEQARRLSVMLYEKLGDNKATQRLQAP